MTAPLFRQDAYLAEAEAIVTAHTPEGGVVLNQCLFYPAGGGQPGDSGRLEWRGRDLPIATAVKTNDDDIALVAAEPQSLPPIGTAVRQAIDWPRRHRLMRMHTALHLLSVVIPLPVSGGAIAEERSRLDFDMPEVPIDRDTLENYLNQLVDRDLPVTEDWITEDELRASPGLVKALSVAPPKGLGQVRLVRIGQGVDQVDLQPCGGTHVARTGEIGRLRLGKFENKGRQNRRVYLHLDS